MRPTPDATHPRCDPPHGRATLDASAACRLALRAGTGATYGYQSVVVYVPSLQLSLAVGTNIEEDSQPQPADVFCSVFNTAKVRVVPSPAESFRILPSPSRVLPESFPIPPDSFRFLPIPSDSSRFLPIPSESSRVLPIPSDRLLLRLARGKAVILGTKLPTCKFTPSYWQVREIASDCV